MSPNIAEEEFYLFNFLVTGEIGAWNFSNYEYEIGRFGEYSTPAIIERFKPLTATAIEELKTLPALFAYEGETEKVKVGYIRKIVDRSNSVLIEYEFELGIPEIPFSKLIDHKVRLDIRKWEMNRTHWAVKDGNLFEILFVAGLIDEQFISPQIWLKDIHFKVALSFPGEKRDYVNKVATELKKQLPRGSVFYDKDFTAQLAVPNSDVLLQKVYKENSDLVVVFLCEEYQRKEWCGLERRVIREHIKNRNYHSVMFMRFDNSQIEGVISSDGYIDLNDYRPNKAARFILERIKLNEATSNTIRKGEDYSKGFLENQPSVKGVVLETFCINPSKCDYKEYVFDSSKPFWIEEDTGFVTYHKGGITVYGKNFPSWEEAKEYKAFLDQNHNHSSFSNKSIHKIYFERLRNEKCPNYPNFYFSVSNHTSNHIVLKAIETEVVEVVPLASIGESHSLPSAVTYKIEIEPHRGKSYLSLIPNLKIEAGDAIGFDLFLIPKFMVGSHSWLMKFKIFHSDGEIETDYFSLIM